MLKIASIPFTFVGETKLGKVFRPYAIISAYSKTRNKWQPVEMIIDTGADYTLFPKRYAIIFGIDITKECFVDKTLGIGGKETVYQYKNLPIRVGNWQRKIPVGFLDRNDIPPLLGRLQCLETLHVVFANKESAFSIP